MDGVPFALLGRSSLLPARLAGAHEKGGVEGQIGWFRRNHLVPVPEVESFEQLNAMVDAWDQADDARRIGSRAHTVGELFAIEQPLLVPLPDEPFETGLWLGPRVDRYSQVTVRTSRYSVPARLVGRQVRRPEAVFQAEDRGLQGQRAVRPFDTLWHANSAPVGHSLDSSARS